MESGHILSSFLHRVVVVVVGGVDVGGSGGHCLVVESQSEGGRRDDVGEELFEGRGEGGRALRWMSKESSLG